MTIVMTIRSAPIDLIGLMKNRREGGTDGRVNLNLYWLDRAYSGDILATMEAIKQALNTDNHDNSDVQSDYFDVGHYVDLDIGRWDKPFVVK
jgi:hypothetical protein